MALGTQLSRRPDSSDLYRGDDDVRHGAQHYRFCQPGQPVAGGGRYHHFGPECVADPGRDVGIQPLETGKPDIGVKPKGDSR